MWSAFRSDLQEFVSTVTEDTSIALSKIDADMSDDGGGKSDDDLDADSKEGLASDDEKGSGIANAKSDADDDDDDDVAVDPEELKEIMTLLREHPGTFTEDLGDEENKEEVEEYLKNFSIDSKTDEISKLLEECPDSLQKNFEDLCPTQVSYEDFWKRYFYRCDEERIAKQLKEETERERRERAEAIRKGISTVTNFFGGAASAISKTLAPETGAPGSSQQHPHHGQSNGINFFGAKGRPPFVMNTAMDESGDDLEDDEELGWDDDDDEDLDFGKSANDSRASEQIEFTDKVSEDLQKQLKQAIEERDQIQETVKMQAEEIKTLKTKLSSTGGSSGGDTDELKMKLFETEAELAALKAQADDSNLEESEGEDKIAFLAQRIGKLPSDQLAELKVQIFGAEEPPQPTPGSFPAVDEKSLEKISALEKQVQELTESLSSKQSECTELEEKFQSTSLELQQFQAKLVSDQANAQSANATVADLESKLENLNAQVDELQAENESLESSAESSKNELESKLSTLQKEHTALQEKVSSLTQQLEQANEKLEQTEDALSQKEKELADAQKQESVSTPAPAATPTAKTPAFATPAMSTTSTIATPLASAMKIDLDEEDGEDDWGDDWD